MKKIRNNDQLKSEEQSLNKEAVSIKKELKLSFNDLKERMMFKKIFLTAITALFKKSDHKK